MGDGTTPRPATSPVAMVAVGGLVSLLLWISPLPARLLEAWLLLVVLHPVAAHPTVRATVLRLERRRRWLFGTLALLVLAGHLAGGARAFPFVSWQMYSTVAHQGAVIYEYRAELRSGRVVPIVVSRLVQPFTANRLVSTLHNQVEGLRSPQSASHSQRRSDHEATLGMVGRLYSRAHPADPVEAVIVTSRPARGPSGGDPADRIDVLWRVELP